MKKIFILFIYIIFSAQAVFSAEKKEVVLMAYDSFDVSKTVVRYFEKTNNVKLKIFKAGDAGFALNKAILSKNNPIADVFFGVSETLLTRAFKADIFEPYNSPLLDKIPDVFKLDPKNRLLPVNFGDVCINYDKKWFKKRNILPPKSISDLVKPKYKGLTVVQNPASSSPGLAFLLSTIACFGEQGYLKYWKKLKQNKVLITYGWKDAYWGHFTAASKGNRPIVISYASSPAAEVYYAEKKLREAPTAAVTKDAFRQIEFAGILKGTQNYFLAQKLLDFLLDKKFQEDIPLQMFVFPVNKSARLPKLFKKYTQPAKNPVTMPYKIISEKRKIWIKKWAETVLH